MKRNGFTLVEMMIVIGIIAILLAIASMYFSAMVRKNNVEGQFKQMYADLMTAKSQALYKKDPSSGQRGKSVQITTAAFLVYSTMTITGAPVVNTVLKVPVTPASTQISFDQSGFATLSSNGSAVTIAYVCDQTNTSSAVINSLIISQTQIQLANASGAGCTGANVKAQ